MIRDMWNVFCRQHVMIHDPLEYFLFVQCGKVFADVADDVKVLGYAAQTHIHEALDHPDDLLNMDFTLRSTEMICGGKQKYVAIVVIKCTC